MHVNTEENWNIKTKQRFNQHVCMGTDTHRFLAWVVVFFAFLSSHFIRLYHPWFFLFIYSLLGPGNPSFDHSILSWFYNKSNTTTIVFDWFRCFLCFLFGVKWPLFSFPFLSIHINSFDTLVEIVDMVVDFFFYVCVLPKLLVCLFVVCCRKRVTQSE